MLSNEKIAEILGIDPGLVALYPEDIGVKAIAKAARHEALLEVAKKNCSFCAEGHVPATPDKFGFVHVGTGLRVRCNAQDIHAMLENEE